MMAKACVACQVQTLVHLDLRYRRDSSHVCIVGHALQIVLGQAQSTISQPCTSQTKTSSDFRLQPCQKAAMVMAVQQTRCLPNAQGIKHICHMMLALCNFGICCQDVPTLRQSSFQSLQPCQWFRLVSDGMQGRCIPAGPPFIIIVSADGSSLCLDHIRQPIWHALYKICQHGELYED